MSKIKNYWEKIKNLFKRKKTTAIIEKENTPKIFKNPKIIKTNELFKITFQQRMLAYEKYLTILNNLFKKTENTIVGIHPSNIELIYEEIFGEKKSFKDINLDNLIKTIQEKKNPTIYDKLITYEKTKEIEEKEKINQLVSSFFSTTITAEIKNLSINQLQKCKEIIENLEKNKAKFPSSQQEVIMKTANMLRHEIEERNKLEETRHF